MEITKLLKEEKQVVSKLFDDLDRVQAFSSKMVIFEQIALELEDHTKAEETVLYSKVKEATEIAGQIEKSEEAHRRIRIELENCRAVVSDIKVFRESVSTLKQLVEKQFQDEENYLYPQLVKVWSETFRRKLGDEFSSQKEELRLAI